MSCNCSNKKGCCGSEHGHEHTNACNHEHGTDEKKCGGGCCQKREITVTQEEVDFLMKLSQIPFLSLVRFVMINSKEDDISCNALSAVHMNNKSDSMEIVKNTGRIISSLHDKGLLSLDYDLPLENDDYELYKTSDLFKYFIDTVTEGAKKPNALFDTAALEMGSLALTDLGQSAISQLDDII